MPLCAYVFNSPSGALLLNQCHAPPVITWRLICAEAVAASVPRSSSCLCVYVLPCTEMFPATVSRPQQQVLRRLCVCQWWISQICETPLSLNFKVCHMLSGTAPGEMCVWVWVCARVCVAVRVILDRAWCLLDAVCSAEVVKSSREVSNVAAWLIGLIYCRI